MFLQRGGNPATFTGVEDSTVELDIYPRAKTVIFNEEVEFLLK